jgi:hypothetical protein
MVARTVRPLSSLPPATEAPLRRRGRRFVAEVAEEREGEDGAARVLVGPRGVALTGVLPDAVEPAVERTGDEPAGRGLSEANWLSGPARVRARARREARRAARQEARRAG